jgi:tetratricopeptide (TPR) repeat protein/predicted aspartyl protease
MLLLAVFAAPQAFADCKIGLTPLSVTMAGTRPLISAKINGRPVRLLADSGAFYGMLSPALAAEIKLPLRPAPFGLTIEGVGVGVVPYLTTVRRLTIDGIDVPNIEFLVGGGEAGQDTAGVLGQNVWHISDVEYDLSDGFIRLARPRGCGGKVLAYWAKNDPVAVADLVDDASGRERMTRAEARVNGRAVKVLFDTGSSYSELTFAAAKRLGIDPDGPGTRPVGQEAGVGRRLARARTTPIDSFEIGGEKIQHTRLMLVDTYLPETDMLLGADFFLSHRIYVANGQHKVYFTYNGGPVFALGAPQTAPVGAPKVSSVVAPDAAKPSPTAPVTTGEALERARHGAAELGRLEYGPAITDLTRAHDLAPKEPLYLYQRAQAYLGNQKPALAVADLDAALALAPDDTDARIFRARMRLATQNRVGAISDLDAASRVLPDQSDDRFALAELYSAADDFGAASDQFDLWIKVHPDDAKLPTALNGRCRAGGLSGTDLPAALRACDAALRREHNPRFLDSRGLVYLRMGFAEKAIADYDAALAKNPKIPWSLYGRGLAEMKLGQSAKAKADMDAGAALAPKLPARARQLGIGV